MNNRKILPQALHLAALAAVLIFALLNSQLYLMGGSYINGEYLESNRHAMEKDRGYALALSGRPMDGELLTEAAALTGHPAGRRAVPGDAGIPADRSPYEPIWLMMSNFYTEEEVLAMTPDSGRGILCPPQRAGGKRHCRDECRRRHQSRLLAGTRRSKRPGPTVPPPGTRPF